ncbi:putative 26S proteasome regulatory subunit mts4 [Ascobolus immersus RN42]|uniref:26S proteasome regulatory subunit RPN1 n=1 Tax=Ascobolus immersus RN42 TaxID=1160509 RepID=A0A3N4HNN5_ASCIM|nr:putative 26S proteasome regulatory subunit mts4 [Ascobolus immersus RN42]
MAPTTPENPPKETKELKKELPIGKSKDEKEDKDKKKDDPKEEDLSEEDQQLKADLEMLVERIKEDKADLYKPSIDTIKEFIRTSTSSMTAVPKPLKFLRPHYETLIEVFDRWPSGEDKLNLADLLSVLGMTSGNEERLDTLNYRLQAPSNNIGGWGHEYLRHLALELGKDYTRRLEKDEDVLELRNLALVVVPFFLSQSAEPDAVDLLTEVEAIDQLPSLLDENTYPKAALYMSSMVNYLSPPEDYIFLKTIHEIYIKFNKLQQAMQVAVRLNDVKLVQEDLDRTSDAGLKKQLGFIAARQQIALDATDPEVQSCLNNSRLSEYFLMLGKELNILDPKVPEDIYKSHLENTRGPSAATPVDTAKQTLSASFVNAFVNAGFNSDKLVLVEGQSASQQSWIYKNKDHGVLSATASIGLLKLWNVESGMETINNYLGMNDKYVRAGAALATGLVTTGVRDENDLAIGLLTDENYIENVDPLVKGCTILGLGIAYVGTQREDLTDLFLPVISDSSNALELPAQAALALGLIHVGSGDDKISSTILQAMMDRPQADLKAKWSRFMSLGLALLYLGRQEESEHILETLKAVEHPIGKHTRVLISGCAYAGTGNVLQFQSMLHLCTDKVDVSEADKEGDDLFQAYAVLSLALIAMGEDVGSEMAIRQFGHLMHYGEPVIRKAVPLAMGLISASSPQMKIYETLSRYSHDNDPEVAINAIFAMGLVGSGTNNARLAQLLRQLASYYHRDPNSLFMVRIAQGLLHLGKGTLTLNPFHTDRSVMSRVATAGLLTVLVSLIDAKQFILDDAHHLLYFLVPAIHPRMLITLDEDLKPLPVSVRVGQAVDVVGAAGRPKTITGWQTQTTPVLLAHGERAELEDDEYISLTTNMEGIAILKKNPAWEGRD